MRFVGILFLTFCCLASAGRAQDLASRVQRMEAAGNTAAARSVLARAVREHPGDAGFLKLYAEFLDQYHDQGARQAYRDLAGKLANAGNEAGRAEVLRRLTLLDLLAGDRRAAARDLEAYHAAGGLDFPSASIPSPAAGTEKTTAYAEIPGPIRSFSRMAALSSHLDPEQVLPALAQNVITSGYRIVAGYQDFEQTEYLKLVVRYLSQARELEKLANENHRIRIGTCDSPQTADLLRVLGYRMRGGCGSEVILETVNASRAFLTIDSGFPLAKLEQSLRTNRPFVYPFAPSRIPVLYGEDSWLTKQEKKRKTPFIDAFLADPALCRAYLAVSKMDPATAVALWRVTSIEKLKAFAHVLDFFGAQFEIRNGKAVVPGGDRSARGWKKLVGASPADGAAFYEKLIAKDDGWLASYYDSLMRIHGATLDYLTAPKRLERFYLALRGRVTSPGPARPVFRSNTDLMLLTTRLWVAPDGHPHVPGDLDVWKRLFSHSPGHVYDKKLSKVAPRWNDADDVVEALFALCRKLTGNEPLQIFITLSDIDRGRRTPLSPEVVERLARSYRHFGAQYQIFATSGAVSDRTIMSFLDTAEQTNHIRNRRLRANAAGSLQALVGLWQIFVRNGLIPPDKVDATLESLLEKFGKLPNRQQLYDSAAAGVKILMKATGAPPKVSAQDYFMDLLAGAVNPPDTATHQQLVRGMNRIFDAQRLVPLGTIFDVANHLEELANGAPLNTAIISRLSARIAKIQPHREGLSSIERSVIGYGYWSERHIQRERKLKIRTKIRKAIKSPEKLRKLRGELVGILRDTLVGFNYIYYAPPGAQILITNPLFVRGHDFIGPSSRSVTWKKTDFYGTGWPTSVGGRLIGSLSGLPFELALVEQNFLVPTNEQALIWGDLAPQMLLSAKVSRWWNVTPSQLHWVALHLRYAESALAESVLDEKRRSTVLGVLARHASPARISRIGQLLREGDPRAALAHASPSTLYFAAGELLAKKPHPDAITREIQFLAATDPDHVSRQAISRAFGTPKPSLAHSYRPALLDLRTFPTLMGYSSRLLAESWESNLLYYAALADELDLPPSRLNLLVPEWTKKTVEQIFATNLDDWPAVLRALRAVGEEARTARRRHRSATRQASLAQPER